MMEIEYCLYSKDDVLRVSCFVDWKETHKTLRYQVPTEYRGDVARFGAPFNFVDRSQIPQTQKEEGQWEVPASRWASVLNGNVDGLSIITEAKYGFRAKMGTLSLTLLRSSTYPDPLADKGKHTIQFAISRHRNAFSSIDEGGESDRLTPTVAKADELFTHPIVLPKIVSGLKPHIEFRKLGSAVPSWIMPSTGETVSGQGFCIRLHEVAGANTSVTFSIPVPGHQAVLVESVNFNEKRLADVPPATGSQGTEALYTLLVGAYKIVTLRVSFL